MHNVNNTEATANETPQVDLGTNSPNFSMFDGPDDDEADFGSAGLSPEGTAGYETIVVDEFPFHSAQVFVFG